ncbi:MAG: DUF6153 family protein [Agrococcus sp.]
MRMLRGVAADPVHRARILFPLLLAAAGVILGLLSMHVVDGGSHAAHGAPAAPAAAHVMPHDAPAPADPCGDAGCDELGVMAVACALALLALLALLPAARAPWRLEAHVPPVTRLAAMRRPAPTPSLIALSISRT